MRAEIPGVVALGALFALCILGGMFVSQYYGVEYQAFGPDTDNPLNSVLYLVLILGFTGGVLLAVKLGGRKVVKGLFLGITGFTVYFVLAPLLFDSLTLEASVAVSLEVAVLLTWLLWRFPEWYVIDTAGVLMCVGLSAILGISFGILPALLLLAMLAVYDAWAVYSTKHMIALADTVMSESLPIMFVIPKHWGYSFLRKGKGLKAQIDSGESRDALFMGLGDVVIPGALVVSAFQFLPVAPSFLGLEANVAVALLTLLGGLAGFCALMAMVLKGNPQAGLPLLNGGTIVAFLIGSAAAYGHVLI